MQVKLLDWDSQQGGWKAIKQRKANQKGSKYERYLLISDLKKFHNLAVSGKNVTIGTFITSKNADRKILRTVSTTSELPKGIRKKKKVQPQKKEN